MKGLKVWYCKTHGEWMGEYEKYICPAHDYERTPDCDIWEMVAIEVEPTNA